MFSEFFAYQQQLNLEAGVVVTFFRGTLTTTRSFQVSRPPPKTLSLEAVVVVNKFRKKPPQLPTSRPAAHPEKVGLELVTKGYTTSTSTSTSDEPPSIE
ncbi:hypothetical protein IBX38_02710 [Candidatus Bathyarchaeota archaeon]|nr:hypothetical protein [Candidatus Bathyarchaeota archaeon]